MGVDQSSGDVQPQGRPRFGRRQIGAAGDEERVDAEDADVVRHLGDVGDDGGVAGGRGSEVDGARDAVAGDVHGPDAAGGVSGSLEEGVDEISGGRNLIEGFGSDVLDEDLVAEGVDGGGGRPAAGETVGAEDGVGDGEDGDAVSVGQIGSDGGGGEEGGEVGEIRVRGKQGGDVQSPDLGCEEIEDEDKGKTGEESENLQLMQFTLLM